MLQVDFTDLVFVNVNEHATGGLLIGFLKDLVEVVVAHLPNGSTKLAQPVDEVPALEHTVFEVGATVAVEVSSEGIDDVGELVHTQPQHPSPEGGGGAVPEKVAHAGEKHFEVSHTRLYHPYLGLLAVGGDGPRNLYWQLVEGLDT